MTNNKLKIIAVLAMIIDHFGYYFNYLLSDEVYLMCRSIGRIAMPIFTFLIVEGYFHTSAFNKYIKRLTILAIVTQIILKLLDFFAKENSYNLSIIANILFSFIVILILIKIFEKTIELRGFKSKLILVIYVSLMLFVYNFIEFDYGIKIIILGFGMYILKKYTKNIYLYKLMLSVLIIIISIVSGNIHLFAIFSCIPIILYNGKLGKKSNIIKTIFYYIFPLQHLLLYGIYIITNMT